MMGKKESSSSSSSSFHRHNLSSSSSSSTRTTTRRSMSPSSSSSMPAQNAIRSSTSSTASSRSSSKSSSRRVVGGSIITMCVIGIILSVISSLSSSLSSPFSSLSSLSTLSLLSFWTATIKNTNEEGQAASAASSIITSNSNSNTISNNNNNNLIPLPQKAVQAEAQAEQVQIQKAEVQEEVQEAQEAVSVLNIHVVPHSHDDVGWLKTIDQYYYGLNNTIQDVSVQNILTSVIQSLIQNPKRTFTYVEMKFFTMWYNQQSLDLQQQVYNLIHTTKQLNFVNGGWCMHDEGTTHYIGMIDQTTLGHTFLRQELNVIPTIGWQLDPFGHSKTQASLLTYKMGLNALYFGRIDYQDLSIRQLTKECEGLWNFNMKDDPSKTSADDNSSIFWGLTGSYNGNYGPPGNFCFDIHCGKGYIPLIDMTHTQLIQHTIQFLVSVREQSERTADKSNNIMITMGEDFQYQNASINYANLDLLIHTIMQNNTDIDIPSIFGPQYNQINIFYSSPEYYTQCKYNETSSKVKSVKSKSKSSVESKSELKKEIRTSSYRGTSSSGSGGVVLVATEKEEEVDVDDGDVNEFNNNNNNRLRRATTTKAHDVKVDDDNDDDDDDEDGDDVGSGSRDDGGGVEWTTKYDDFFPYSDCPNCFWTGYFTSRPSLKKFERIGSSFILASRQILSSRTSTGTSSSLADPTVSNTCTDQMYLLDDAHGVLQHHDGVSGTSKQHVAYDYAKRLQEGIDGVVPCLIHKLKDQFLGGNSSSNDNNDDRVDNNNYKYLKDLTYCQLLNETICDISTTSTGSDSSNTDLYVIVYNSLASERSTIIDLPVGSSGKYIIVESLVVLEDEEEDEDKDKQHTYEQTIEAQQRPFMLSRSTSVDNNDNNDNDSSFVLSFMADSLPPVGAKVFRIRKQADSELLVDKKNQQQIKGHNNNNNNSIEDDDDDLTEIFNGRFTFVVNTKTGNIHRIGAHDLFEQQQKQQQEGQEGQNKNNLLAGLSAWGYYTSFDSNGTSSQNSGAYIFRPSTPNQKLHLIPVTNTTVVNKNADSVGGGYGGIEIHTKYEESWIQTITRIRKDVPYIEIEYQVGPIPINDGVGKEIVTRYNTNVDNDAIFYTDSNGREFMKRQRNHRPTWDLSVYEPVAGNYYPVNTAIYVEGKQQEQRNDKSSSPPRSAAFAVVTDRTQGGSSILDGTIELMVHRRTLVDDGRGVGEPINETDIGITSCPPYGNATRIGEGLIIRGKHRIIVVDAERETTISATTTTNTTTEVGNKSNDYDDSFGAQLARSEMDASFAEPLVFVGTAPSSEEIPFRVKSFSGLKKSLPHNIMLITKQLLYDDNDEKEEEQEKESTTTSTSTFLVRLGHQYAIGEDIVLSLPVNIDLSIIFPGQSIKDIQETTLSGNRDIEDWRNERFDWTGTGTGTSTSTGRPKTEQKNDDVSSESYTITLTPMDIRTFKIQV